MSHPTEAVTSLITHHVKPDSHDAYEDWLDRIIPAASEYSGHQGINVLRPADNDHRYTLALRFDTHGNLINWLESPTRAALMDDVAPLLSREEDINVHHGLDFWFPVPSTPAGAPVAAPRWKQWLATVVALYPLTLVVPTVVSHLGDWLAIPTWPALRGLLVVAMNVALLTFVIMPRWTRLLRPWLYRRPTHGRTSRNQKGTSKP
ncbi:MULTISPECIES: antibiotic biosynthesis monooxygenase [unclassified Streptomyces]|uniref:antibiotic biosynthesis monooxygenase n=1 Tax=unclassified Streptomyces TaxID=2593676 RepID=UPI000DB9E4D1|nr:MULTISPECIES: antibiotic biosynthesis monooxygenase [unclassified Streptomyces]MYT73481.1 antibiotic biosynthesis monooxygenase [Streptomyces sp. SID8367]RAJ85013.1 hypothetical protein K377_03494 [Streptomyces sp. PsTaAH-137]